MRRNDKEGRRDRAPTLANTRESPGWGCPYGVGLRVEAELGGDLGEHLGEGAGEGALAAQEGECCCASVAVCLLASLVPRSLWFALRTTLAAQPPSLRNKSLLIRRLVLGLARSRAPTHPLYYGFRCFRNSKTRVVYAFRRIIGRPGKSSSILARVSLSFSLCQKDP